MDKNLKSILIVLNSLITLLSVFWFFSEKGYEPVIVFISQISSILLITNESKFSKTKIKDVSMNSDIDIVERNQSNSNTQVQGIESSKIRIRKE